MYNYVVTVKNGKGSEIYDHLTGSLDCSQYFTILFYVPNCQFIYVYLILLSMSILPRVSVKTTDFLRLAKDKIPNLRGCKHTSPSLSDMHRCLVDHGDQFDIIMGTDEVSL